jgi:hypothetical protein
MDKNDLREKYIETAKVYKTIEEKEEKKILIYSILRLIVFAGGIIFCWIGFTIGVITGLLCIIFSLSLFLLLLKLFAEHSDRKEFFGNHIKINNNEADALQGNLSHFDSGEKFVDPNHDFSHDVDVFGANSLFHNLNRTVTGYGKDLLAEWFKFPFTLSDQIKKRQDAIRELASRAEWRHNFSASGIGKTFEKSEIEGILDWLNEGSSITFSKLSKILLYILPGITIISFILSILSLIPFQVFSFLFLLNLLIISMGLKKINKIHNVLTGKYNFLASTEKLLKTFENVTFESEILNEIRKNISGKDISASVTVKRLRRLVQIFDNRLNIIVSVFLNGFLLWDYQSVLRLERWKLENKGLLPVWLKMIGTVDAYISLANLAANNPEFIYPEISDRAVIFNAKGMGHPLINADVRVCNDFNVSEKGIIIITGANMAGKSTFLRTVAVNFILGMAGAPVCASELTFTPIRLFTSMRTTDSLSGNESYFYAELKRLKELKLKVENKENVFFILDEILKGTNSADKSLGSRMFLEKLAEMGGTGMIATHDVSLGELEKSFPGKILNMCFEVEIEGDLISFDYKLQQGITRKMNAAILMRQMGIIG